LYNIEKDMCKRIRQGKKDLVGELQVQDASTEHRGYQPMAIVQRLTDDILNTCE